MHSTDEGHGNSTPPASSIVDRSFLRTDPRQFNTTCSRYTNKALGAHIESGTPERGFSNQNAFASPFASAVANQGFSNQGSNVNLFVIQVCHLRVSSPTNGDIQTRRPHSSERVCISVTYYSIIYSFPETFLKFSSTLLKGWRRNLQQVLATDGPMKGA